MGASLGFFAYVQSLDLNKVIGTASTTTPRGRVVGDNGDGSMQEFYGGANGTTPNPIEDNTMPKVSQLIHPAATVYMFDTEFNPNTELNGRDTTPPAPQTLNSTIPAERFKGFASRHALGGVINFCDGHAGYYKSAYVTNGMTTAMWGNDEESPTPDIIWDPAYRAWIGH